MLSPSPRSGRWIRRGNTIFLIGAASLQGELEQEFSKEQLATLRALAQDKAERSAHRRKGGNPDAHFAAIARKAREIFNRAKRIGESRGFATAVADLQREMELEAAEAEMEGYFARMATWLRRRAAGTAAGPPPPQPPALTDPYRTAAPMPPSAAAPPPRPPAPPPPPPEPSDLDRLRVQADAIRSRPMGPPVGWRGLREY